MMPISDEAEEDGFVTAPCSPEPAPFHFVTGELRARREDLDLLRAIEVASSMETDELTYLNEWRQRVLMLRD